MIESMFSEKTTAAQKEEIRRKMLASPQHVMASAFEGMVALDPIKPGEKYSVPVMAVMAERRDLAAYQTQLSAIFPNFRYVGWQGAGHFLMIEDPDRFNRLLEEFLGELK